VNVSLAYRAGVTTATSSLAKPIFLGGSEAHVISGLSTTFRTGSAHAMQRGAIVQDVAALHIVMGKPNPSLGEVGVSTQLAALRRLLYGWETQDRETGHWFRQAAEVRAIHSDCLQAQGKVESKSELINCGIRVSFHSSSKWTMRILWPIFLYSKPT
jgi:hypothetical protein